MGKGHGRRAEEERGGKNEVGGCRVAGGNGYEMGPTPILPRGPAIQESFCSARLWARDRGSGRKSPPQLGEEECKMATAKPWEGSPRQGMKLGPGLPRQSSSGSRICPHLASSGQAMAQVSDTWGPESHAKKLNTLGPQPPTSSSYEQAGLQEEEAGLQSGAAGRLLPGRGQPRRKLSYQQG